MHWRSLEEPPCGADTGLCGLRQVTWLLREILCKPPVLCQTHFLSSQTHSFFTAPVYIHIADRARAIYRGPMQPWSKGWGGMVGHSWQSLVQGCGLREPILWCWLKRVERLCTVSGIKHELCICLPCPLPIWTISLTPMNTIFMIQVKSWHTPFLLKKKPSSIRKSPWFIMA